MVRVFYFYTMKDFLIVGAGLAGISFAEQCYRGGKSFVVINNNSQNSTRVAGGLYNPVILKRFKLATHAAEQSDYIRGFYSLIEHRLNTRFDFPLPIYRKFFSVEEQNAWFEASDKPGPDKYLSTKLIHRKFDALPSPFGFGEVRCTGYLDTDVFLDSYHKWLKENGSLLEDTFDYNDLHLSASGVNYKAIEARNIVFAEGFGIHANPYFNYLPLEGTKGQLLIIKAPNLNLDVSVNAGIFILPVGENHYKVGATYEWHDKSPDPTVEGLTELTERLEQVITCPYEVVKHMAGIRPTVKDRRPLVGTHAKYKNVHILNGLGTRGVLLGPPMALELYNAIEENREVDPFVNINRFKEPGSASLSGSL